MNSHSLAKMGESTESEIASLLSVLSLSEGETLKCPLAIFARSLQCLLREKNVDACTLCDVIAVESLELSKEEEEINATKRMISLAYGKLRAEINRLETQMRVYEGRLEEIAQQKNMCRIALNALVAGDVPRYVRADAAAAVFPMRPPTSIEKDSEESLEDCDGETTPCRVAPASYSLKNDVLLRTSTSVSTKGTVKAAGRSGASEAKQNSAGAQGGASSQSPLLPSSVVSSASLLTTLRLPEVKETSLLHAIESYELQTFTQDDGWISTERYPDILAVLLALLKHLPEPRPPVQLAELRLLEKVFQAAPTSSEAHNRNLVLMLETLLTKANTIFVLVSLLGSVNDDVKCVALECLSSLVCGTYPFAVAGLLGSPELCRHACRKFLDCDGLKLLIRIVAHSSSEAVMECALVFLWGLLSRDDKALSDRAAEKPIRTKVVALGGLRAVLDLLFTDSLAILGNVCMVIGYLTRDDASKKEIREIGGLEKLIATLRHYSTSIKTKIAGAMWNCASNEDNRTSLRKLGAIPALLELLIPNGLERVETATYEFLRENVAGALWNLSVDIESKTQIADYGGIPLLIKVMTSSASIPVLVNITGIMWNCSSSAEVRSVICKSGGITVFLSLLNAWKTDALQTTVSPTVALASKTPFSERIFDNVIGTLRNFAIDNRFKSLICESGGVGLLLHYIQGATLDFKGSPEVSLSSNTLAKIVATLWIMSTLSDSKLEVAHKGGIEMLVKVLEWSSPVLAAAAKSSGKVLSLFPSIEVHEKSHLDTPYDFFQTYFSPRVLQRVPSSPPAISLSMSIREMIVGVLRNCSTVLENRKRLIECNVIQSLLLVMLDCYSSKATFSDHDALHKSISHEREPSVQLKENISSAIWYLSREDKVVLREQGGLKLMCMFLLTPNESVTVLEQAAGALSSLTGNNSENREAIRHYGGLHALVQIISDTSTSECSPSTKTDGKNAKTGVGSCNNLLYNALLTVRNATLFNEKNVKYCSEAVMVAKDGFGSALLYILQHGSEECAREVAMVVKNLCVLLSMREWFERGGITVILNKLSESTSSDSVRRALAGAKRAISQAL